MPKILPTMPVLAVEGRLLPAIDAQGRPLLGRHVGRTRKGAVILEGVVVPQDPYHQRAVARGDLVLLTEPAPQASEPEAAPESAAAAQPE